MHKPV